MKNPESKRLIVKQFPGKTVKMSSSTKFYCKSSLDKHTNIKTHFILINTFTSVIFKLTDCANLFINWLTDRLIDWAIYRLIDWVIEWFIDLLIVCTLSGLTKKSSIPTVPICLYPWATINSIISDLKHFTQITFSLVVMVLTNTGPRQNYKLSKIILLFQSFCVQIGWKGMNDFGGIFTLITMLEFCDKKTQKLKIFNSFNYKF